MIKSTIKSLLKDHNESTVHSVKVGANKTKLWVSYHDYCHVKCSELNPILIGKDWVTGIHGVPIKEFGREGEESLYCPYLDEARVAIHQWCLAKSPCAWARLVFWSGWLILKGINPINVVFSHINTL